MIMMMMMMILSLIGKQIVLKAVIKIKKEKVKQTWLVKREIKEKLI